MYFLEATDHPHIIKYLFHFQYKDEQKDMTLFYIGMECASKTFLDLINEKN